MGLLDSFRSRLGLGRPRRSIYLDERGNPKTIIATGEQKGGGMSSSERSDATLKKYWDYYNGEGTIFASINTTAWNTIMVGIYLSSENDNAKKLIQEYLDRLDLESVLLDNTIYALVYGDSFIEIVRKGKEPSYLKTVDPTTVVINFDKFGNVESYQQKIQGQLQKTLLKPEDIIHLRFFPKPSTPYGISLIEPSRDTIDRKITTDEAISNAIIRHGTSKYLVKVGTPEEIPPASVFTDIKNELEDITTTNEFIVPGLIDITSIDEKGIPGVEDYFTLFQTQLIIGLLCPEEALGLGRGSTEATSKVKEIMYERMIRSFQMKISNQLRVELVNPILESNGFDPNIVKVRFNSVTDADEAVKAKWLGNLLRGYPEGQKPFSINEVRALFGFAPVKEEDVEEEPEPESGKKPEPEEEEPENEEPEEEPEEETEEEKPKKESISDVRRDIIKLKKQISDMKFDIEDIIDEKEE